MTEVKLETSPKETEAVTHSRPHVYVSEDTSGF